MAQEDFQKAHEAEITRLANSLLGHGAESDWALVRALVHRAVHLAAERGLGEFCAVATLLAEMVGHAHDLHHPSTRPAPRHTDVH